jgi:peptide/nickel transport system substrate-binding protein
MPSQRWLGLGLLAVVLVSASWVTAQPPRKEEEEEPKEKARPAVPVPVAEPDKKDAPPAIADAVDPDVGTFKEELGKATSLDAKAMFRALSLPYDRLDSTFRTGTTFYVELLQSRDLPEEEFEVRVLDASKKNSVAKKLSTGSGFNYTPFELIVVEQVDSFLAKTESTMDRSDQLEYAARAVAAGLRWHLVAVNNNKRVGKAWETVASQLKFRLRDLMRKRFEYLLDVKRYERADEVGLKMLSRFPNDNEILLDVYHLQLKQTELKTKGTDADLIKLRESLLLYERLSGKKNEGLIKTVRARLRSRAKALLDEARADGRQQRSAAALSKLRMAETLDPDLPGIEDARAGLKGTVLYVGVSKLPERMSPATATTDAERWAVELMFEGLLQTVPDPEVIRYRPALAESLPGVMPLGRSFTLPRNLRWARDDAGQLDARDVQATLEMLREHRDRWYSEGVEVFQAIDRVNDNFRLRLAYDRGVLEPLGRATFKVLPAHYLRDRGKSAEDADFAKSPFGSGPFRYEGREREGAVDNPRECAVFRTNPYYGQRPGKFGLPWIREIRMYVPSQSTLSRDVPAGQLHLFPDPPGDLIPRFRNDAALKDIMRVQTAATNRRIHILAINHKNADLQNDKVRQGLSAAINRDAILTEVFRSGNKDEKIHEALAGPFPVKSWATPQAAREVILYKPGAGGLFTEALTGGRKIKLSLLFDAEDPKNALVCQRIKAQVEEASANKDGKPLVQIEPQGATTEKFREKLYQEHGYDLALTTFDYRDDLYSLAGLLDPEATGRDARNFLNYMASGTNPGEADRRLRRKIDEVRKHRDFTVKVQSLTWDIHTLFNLRVPFVPLWQLDRFIVVHKDVKLHIESPNVEVKAEQLDPAVLFTGVEMWRLE